MSGEKTEEPTQKKLDDAKKKGQNAKSQDVNAAASLVAPLQIAAPLAIGAAADAWGTTIALVFLAAQPIGLAVISASTSIGTRR